MSLGVEYNVLERVRTFVRTKVPSKVQYNYILYLRMILRVLSKVQLYVVVHVLVTYTRSAVVQRCTCTAVQFTARCTPRLFNGNNSVHCTRTVRVPSRTCVYLRRYESIEYFRKYVYSCTRTVGLRFGVVAVYV